jgi:hypothetical protein
LRWLNIVTGVTAFKWSAGFGRFLQVSALASHWLEDCANFTPTQEEMTKISSYHYLSQRKLALIATNMLLRHWST